MPDAPPSNVACVECGASMQGENLGLGGRLADRRTDRRIHIEGIGDLRGFTVAYQCPDCGHLWPRFPDGHPSNKASRVAMATAVARAAKKAQSQAPPT